MFVWSCRIGVHQKGLARSVPIVPISPFSSDCSDLRFVLSNTLMCFESLGFLLICFALFSEQIRTNQGKPISADPILHVPGSSGLKIVGTAQAISSCVVLLMQVSVPYTFWKYPGRKKRKHRSWTEVSWSAQQQLHYGRHWFRWLVLLQLCWHCELLRRYWYARPCSACKIRWAALADKVVPLNFAVISNCSFAVPTPRVEVCPSCSLHCLIRPQSVGNWKACSMK